MHLRKALLCCLVILLTQPLAWAAHLGSAYLLTTSTSANVTTLHLINSSLDSQAFTGTLYSGSGGQLGAADLMSNEFLIFVD